MKRIVIGWCVLITSLCASLALAETKPISPDLTRIAEGKAWTVVGRKAMAFEADGKKGISINKTDGIGIAWLNEIAFTEGEIEIDLKGEDIAQQSFLGVAFRVVDDTTHDAVYFRPFNFKSDDAVKRTHAVQYVSHPDNTWRKLRDEKPGQYEKPVNPAPDPNGWFHARIVVAKRKIKVYVNAAKEPCLVVDELSARKGGKVGLWIGDGSGGQFANLKITRRP